MVYLDVCKGLNHIGRLGEHEHRTLRFWDSANILAMYPEATVTVLHKRPGDAQAYPVAPGYVEIQDGIVLWTIQSGDLAHVGKGQVELVFHNGNTIAKSIIFDTFIDRALDGAGDPPEPWESWIAEVTDAADRAEDAADLLENPGVTAETLSAGSEAIASYSDGEFHFGIPRGQQGSKGDPGDDYVITEEDYDEIAEAVVESQGLQRIVSDATDSANLARNYADGKDLDGKPNAQYSENNAEYFSQQAAAKLAEVNAAGTTQIDAIEAKGDEVYSSIPIEYSELSAKVKEIDSNVFSDYGYKITSQIAQGGRDKTHLNPTGNQYRCTTKDLFELKVGDHVVVTGIGSGQRYTLAGIKNSAYVYDSGWKTEDLTFIIPAAGSYFVNITKQDSSAITPQELSMTFIVYTLEYQNRVIGCSKANMLSERNAHNLIDIAQDIIKSGDGITWKWTEDAGINAQGTSTTTALYDFIHTGKGDAFPAWIIPGKTYNIEYSASVVYFRILVATESDSSFVNVVDTKTNAIFTAPADITGIVIRLVVSGAGVTANETVYPRIWDTDSNADIKALAGSALDTANAAVRQSDIAKNAIDNGHIITDEFVQGHRTKDIFPEPSKNPFRCTTKTYYELKAGDMIAVSGVPESEKQVAIIGVKNGAYTYDGSWTSTNISYTVQSGKDGYYFVNVYNNGSALTPNDFELTVSVWTSAQLQTQEKFNTLSDIADSLSFDNPLVAHYKDFVQKTVSYDSNHNLVCTTDNAARWSLVFTPTKQVHLRMLNSLFVFRFYWYKDSTEHSTDWGTDWDIPVTGQQVGLTIKRRDGTVFGNDRAFLYLVTSEDIEKDYYTAEIASVTERVKKYNQEPGLTFLLSTDQHTMGVQGTLLKYDTITDMSINMKKVAKKVNVDAVLSLGDVADFKVGSQSAFAKYGITDLSYSNLDRVFYDWLDYAMDKLASIHPNFIYVPGNHDDNRYINHDNVQADPSEYDYTKGQMYSYYTQRSQIRRVSNPLNNGLDFYIDYPDQKIRMFCIDSSHWYETTMSWHQAHSWWYGFMQETVDWMTEQLGLVPSDWSVMILTHFSPVGANNGDNTGAYPGMSDLTAAIQNYINGGGKFIAELYGHSHCDWSTTTPWLDITFAAQKCQNPSLDFPNMPGMIVPTRTTATATEDCWNVVMVQPGSKRIVCIRFGAGNDRIFHYDDKPVSSSITLTTELTGSITWSSNKTDVATVSNGVVTAGSSGRAQITAKDENGDSEVWSVVVS